MKITEASHLDHGLTPAAIAFIRERFAGRAAFFLETVELPAELAEGLVCGLHGPSMGDEPIGEDAVSYEARGDRAYPSRLVERPARPTRLLTVIAGPHGDEPCVLYTAFGGPAAPREPGDPSLPEHEREASVAFWAEHALTR